MKRTDAYAAQGVTQTVEELQVSLAQGLAGDEAARRLDRIGPNEIATREETLLHRIGRRFWGPIPWMIELAAILSAAVGKWDDFGIILVMLFINVFLDFFQEHRALNALKALQAGLAKSARVRRDGAFKSLPVRELVPGDIVKLRLGEIVPADIQLAEGDFLMVDQSSLTGESLPVSRKHGEVIYANTIVKQGEMLGVVVNTGMNTDFSGVVALVAQAQLASRSHFQEMVMQIGRFLILVTVLLVMLIVLVALFRHQPMLEILRFALVLAVAAIPVALPAVLSVTMAVGAVNLARKRAIVSRLTAIEELAGVDVFCSDKTGTLTRNEMTVVTPVVLDGHDERELFEVAALASRLENQDPIELPIFHYLDTHFDGGELTRYTSADFKPFDPIGKHTAATVDCDAGRFTALKGAPQVLIAMAALDETAAQGLSETVDQLAARGYRTLAVGRRAGEGDGPVELVGLIPLQDPPRDDSRTVIDEMHENGVRVKMITGDNLAIAREIGRLLGLEEQAIRSAQLSGAAGSELMDLIEVLAGAIHHRLDGTAALAESRAFAKDVIDEVRKRFDTRLIEREFLHTHESAIVEMIESVDIFAEVVPEDKYRIVDTLQKGGHIVAMTGDGVNDAPALKKADCGFAVSNATDAARAAADIILTAPGLSVINDAVKQARITFERMKSYATFRIAETMRIILFMALSILVFDFYPITPLMIILLALLNDIPILTIAYDHTRVQGSPVRWNMKELLTLSSLLGLTGVVFSFLLFFLLEEWGVPRGEIQTWLFLKLIVAGHFTLYITRAPGWFWQRPYPAPILFAATFGTELLGTLFAAEGWFMAPIGWQGAALVWAYALTELVISDVVKTVAVRTLLQPTPPTGKRGAQPRPLQPQQEPSA
ncbi:HAD-IC family P-type ATPase [Nitrogeniibacter mangrovi]|uniref:HAD-IC family P-type ATPase n=1 Tax=Nitrogeniibacter mangrovi TaxID=2016596 RepID=A0A6C1B745_9RHOO|nr:plasma-membrane proton-efflux P-type ATPase [Nitrogeniibacter mangrovi]QID19586.1 HAD-IC family P-type ATPase [Nitrogeniibacter mangrovi]